MYVFDFHRCFSCTELNLYSTIKMDKKDKSVIKSPTVWTRPAEVMKMHRLKQKKRALQFRMTDNGSAAKGNVQEMLNETSSSAEPDNIEENTDSNFNPFRYFFILKNLPSIN